MRVVKSINLTQVKIESRLTTERHKLTEQQRATTPPWETMDRMLESEMRSYESVGEVRKAAPTGRHVYSERSRIAEMGIEEGIDVSNQLSPTDAAAYRKQMKSHIGDLTTSEPRSLFEIGKDLRDLGAYNEKVGVERFTHSEIKGIQRLLSDSLRQKLPFDEYLKKMGFAKDQVKFMIAELNKVKNKREPLDERPADVTQKGATAGDVIVKQRKKEFEDGTVVYSPEIYASEVQMMLDATELRSQTGFRTLDTPIRTFEEAGLKPIYHAWRAADSARVKEGVAIDGFLKELKDTYKLSKGSQERIYDYSISEQKGGMKILEANNKTVPKLTSEELATYNELRNMYEDYFTRINEVRTHVGKNPLDRVDNYFTFARVMNELTREGIVNNLVRESGDVIMGQYTHFKATPFQFAKTRTGGVFKPANNAFKVFKMYSDAAAKHIHISPIASKVNELVNTRLPNAEGNMMSQMAIAKPNLSNFLNGWSDYIAGKPVVSKWPGWVGDKGIRMLRKNIAYSALQWNARSAVIQMAAARNTMTQIGFKHWAEGVIENLNPRMRNKAMTKSEHLHARTPEAEMGEWAYIHSAWKWGFKPLQWLDLETARATWLGARRFGQQKYGLKGKELTQFADDTVVRTQASASAGDISPIQRSELGKAMTMFQTFVINDWGFLTKDVLNWKKADVHNPVHFAKVYRYVVATSLISMIYEDLFGIPSPLPRPLKTAYDSVQEGENIGRIALNVAKEMMEPIPIIGGPFRYGHQFGGPAYELIDETRKKFTDDPIQRPWLELIARGSGIPGTGQFIKYQRGQKRGEGTVGSILGTYSGTQSSSSTSKRSSRASRATGRSGR